MVNGGEILLMPTTASKLQIVPGPLDNPDKGYRSRFDHAEETASPGYYSVFLKDYNIKAELTSTKELDSTDILSLNLTPPELF